MKLSLIVLIAVVAVLQAEERVVTGGATVHAYEFFNIRADQLQYKLWIYDDVQALPDRSRERKAIGTIPTGVGVPLYGLLHTAYWILDADGIRLGVAAFDVGAMEPEPSGDYRLFPIARKTCVDIDSGGLTSLGNSIPENCSSYLSSPNYGQTWVDDFWAEGQQLRSAFLDTIVAVEEESIRRKRRSFPVPSR